MSNIKIGGDDKYQGDVKKQMDAIWKYPVARVLVQLIQKNPKLLWIEPNTDESCEASLTRPDKSEDAAPKDVTPYAGHAYGAWRQSDGRVVTLTPQDKAQYKGTGAGSDVRVFYLPGIYGGSGCFGGKYGSQPDEVLFHELVHAYRDMSGRDNPIPVAEKLFAYLNEEEWLAILITNIYISAKNGNTGGLRRDHDGHEELKPPLNTSDGFLNNEDHRKLVQKYYLLEERYLFSYLASIRAPYNPIRQFWMDL